MAVNETRRWLIAYDIREPRRLARVHRLLSGAAVPIQYSVFAASGSMVEIKRLAEQLRGLIDPGADDVRIYAIPKRALVHCIGPSRLPEDAWLLEGQGNMQALLGRKFAGTPGADGVGGAVPKMAGNGIAKCSADQRNLKRSV